MRKNQQRPDKNGNPIDSSYFQRYGQHFTGERVPFGALIDFLPSSADASSSSSKMAPRTHPGFFIGYYENSRGLTSDYVVIPLTQLVNAQSFPNDPSSWRLTPQRPGRVIFNRNTPMFPLKASYDVRRESILEIDMTTGKPQAPLGAPVPLLDNEGNMPPAAPNADSARGDSSSSTDGAAPKKADAEPTLEFLPEVLLEFPDGYVFPFSDPDVYGRYFPVRQAP